MWRRLCETLKLSVSWLKMRSTTSISTRSCVRILNMYKKRSFVGITAIKRLIMSYFKISTVTLLILDYILFNRAHHPTAARLQHINELMLDNGNSIFLLHIGNKHANGDTTLILSENDKKANHCFSTGPLTNVTLDYYSDAYPSVVIRNFFDQVYYLYWGAIFYNTAMKSILMVKYGTRVSIT